MGKKKDYLTVNRDERSPYREELNIQLLKEKEKGHTRVVEMNNRIAAVSNTWRITAKNVKFLC